MRRDSLRRHPVTARFPRTIVLVAVVWLQTALAGAQQPPPPAPQPPPAAPTTTTTTTPESNIPQIDDVHSDRQELTNGQKTQHHMGHVESVSYTHLTLPTILRV